MDIRTAKLPRWVFPALLAIYAIAIAYVVVNHEPWRDEGGDWMTVRDISLSGLLSWWVPQAGHPPVYYLILFPLAKAGLPLITINWVEVILLVGAMYLFVFRTRLPAVVKLAIFCSYFFLYEYPVIGRPYGLAVFAVALITAVYPQRFTKPWYYALAMALLFNSDTSVFPFACGLTAVYAFETLQYKKLNAKYILPLLFIGLSGAYIIPYMVLPGMKLRSQHLNLDAAQELQQTLGNAFFLWSVSTAAVGLFMLLALSTLSRPKVLAVLIAGCGGVLYLFCTKYKGDMRHHGMIVVLLTSCFALAEYYRRDTSEPPFQPGLTKHFLLGGEILFSILMFLQLRTATGIMGQDIEGNFTGGKDAAAFLMDRNLDHKILVGHNSWAATAVLQFLPKDVRMYYPDCDRWGTYIIYDSLYEAVQFGYSGDYAAYMAEKRFGNKLKDVVLVMNQPIQEPALRKDWQPIYHTEDEPMKRQESFVIYEFTGGQPAVPMDTTVRK